MERYVLIRKKDISKDYWLSFNQTINKMINEPWHVISNNVAFW